MESLILELATLFIVGLVGALTPGPDILFVLRNTISFGAKAGFFSLLGISCGWLIFISLIYFGFAHLINGALPQGILSFIGGFYLLYISFLLFKKPKNTIDFADNTPPTKAIFDFVFKGFLLNLSNPKAILFFAVIIAPFMNQHLEISLLVLLCGLFLAFLMVIVLGIFFRRFINNALFDRIDKICGIVFIGFAILLLISSYQSFYTFFGEIQSSNLTSAHF
ncbi:LysE family translocator [Helicobacter sp. MIT 05-5294]|uniref:LysE family translocator n=1 Tax=Helicobacter sp. MIT 05-5294 TaxID=1548150 RepID=UPI000A967619|nr:LysE family translocator [Helicobacter sp. MIT 05-5294]TLD87794.1 LysE family translocator [Helicobacter sp. MIT 05-5294]